MSKKPRTRQKVLSFRIQPVLQESFDSIVEASQRSQTSIAVECLEEVLPRLERKYFGQGNSLKRKAKASA